MFIKPVLVTCGFTWSALRTPSQVTVGGGQRWDQFFSQYSRDTVAMLRQNYPHSPRRLHGVCNSASGTFAW